MIKHRILVRHSRVEFCDRLSIPLIRGTIRRTLCFEGIDVPCEVSVLITDESRICEINRLYRGVDKPTDVLSFPMQEFSAPGRFAHESDVIDPLMGFLPLGDIVFSASRVRLQARRYAQTCETETAYLTVHSVLHLLGYDHADEAEDKRKMREREKEIMRASSRKR